MELTSYTNRAYRNLDFSDLVELVPSIQHYDHWEGKDIALKFNEKCEYGLEVRYLDNSVWQFTCNAEAEETLGMLWEKDQKRCGLDSQ